jgi:hypothetical protein
MEPPHENRVCPSQGSIPEAFHRVLSKISWSEATDQLAIGFVYMSAGKMNHALALQEVGHHAATLSQYDVGLYHVAF